MGSPLGFYNSGRMRLQGEQNQAECAACRGKGWRFIRAHRVSAESRLAGEPVGLRRVACFDCPEVAGEAA
jgi:hypothetical protein